MPCEHSPCQDGVGKGGVWPPATTGQPAPTPTHRHTCQVHKHILGKTWMPPAQADPHPGNHSSGRSCSHSRQSLSPSGPASPPRAGVLRWVEISALVPPGFEGGSSCFSGFYRTTSPTRSSTCPHLFTFKETKVQVRETPHPRTQPGGHHPPKRTQRPRCEEL